MLDLRLIIRQSVCIWNNVNVSSQDSLILKWMLVYWAAGVSYLNSPSLPSRSVTQWDSTDTLSVQKLEVVLFCLSMPSEAGHEWPLWPSESSPVRTKALFWSPSEVQVGQSLIQHRSRVASFCWADTVHRYCWARSADMFHGYKDSPVHSFHSSSSSSLVLAGDWGEGCPLNQNAAVGAAEFCASLTICFHSYI